MWPFSTCQPFCSGPDVLTLYDVCMYTEYCAAVVEAGVTVWPETLVGTVARSEVCRPEQEGKIIILMSDKHDGVLDNKQLNCLFNSLLIITTTKFKSMHRWHFMRGIHWRHQDSTGPVMESRGFQVFIISSHVLSVKYDFDVVKQIDNWSCRPAGLNNECTGMIISTMAARRHASLFTAV